MTRHGTGLLTLTRRSIMEHRDAKRGPGPMMPSSVRLTRDSCCPLARVPEGSEAIHANERSTSIDQASRRCGSETLPVCQIQKAMRVEATMKVGEGLKLEHQKYRQPQKARKPKACDSTAQQATTQAELKAPQWTIGFQWMHKMRTGAFWPDQ